MLNLILTINAIASIIWIVRFMHKSANPVNAVAAMGWMLAYLWAPQVLLTVAALLNPIVLLTGAIKRTQSLPAPPPASMAALLGTGVVVPKTMNDLRHGGAAAYLACA